MAVAGATGALGTRVCAALLARGASVRALVRNPASPEAEKLGAAGAELRPADLRYSSTLPHALAGATVVVSTATCFPREDAIDLVDRDGNLALIEAAEAAGCRRFVFVSFKPVPLDFPLQRAKRAVEARLARSRLEAVVLRPGKFMDVWFSPLLGFDPEARRATVFGAGTAPVSWIAAADVAEIAARSALGKGTRTGAVELGGPEALSQREVIAIYEQTTRAQWQIEEVSVESLERMLYSGETAASQSLGALMLEAHLGSVIDPAHFLDAFPIRLTTVREFAAAYSRCG